MTKLITIYLLVLFTISGNAQWYHRQFNVLKINDLNQNQLNLAHQKSIQTIRIGQIMTGVGAGFGIIGGIMVGISTNMYTDTFGPIWHRAVTIGIIGGVTLSVGIVSTVIGIPTWIIGSTRKKEIKIALVKFNSVGSASINGIGLKLRF